MSSAQIAKKIDSLPEMLQLQVNDFVEFLISRHFKENKSEPTEDELPANDVAELNKRYQEYVENPESAVSIDSMKTRLMKKYGLSTVG
jgi:hypothetical protein